MQKSMVIFEGPISLMIVDCLGWCHIMIPAFTPIHSPVLGKWPLTATMPPLTHVWISGHRPGSKKPGHPWWVRYKYLDVPGS